MTQGIILALTGLVALLVLLVTTLSKRSTPATTEYDADSACELRSLLVRQRTAGQVNRSLEAYEIRLFWWHRFGGIRRARKQRRTRRCSGGMRCVSDSRPEAFASAHAVIVFVGARPERSCLPPRLPDHSWVVNFVESPANYPELYDPIFMSRFNLKVLAEHCLHPPRKPARVHAPMPTPGTRLRYI